MRIRLSDADRERFGCEEWITYDLAAVTNREMATLQQAFGYDDTMQVADAFNAQWARDDEDNLDPVKAHELRRLGLAGLARAAPAGALTARSAYRDGGGTGRAGVPGHPAAHRRRRGARGKRRKLHPRQDVSAVVRSYTPAILATFHGIRWDEVEHLPHDFFLDLVDWIDQRSGGGDD
jgi:hypothetical protein